jgi:hypothetical protein
MNWCLIPCIRLSLSTNFVIGHITSYHVISCHFMCHKTFPISFQKSREGRGVRSHGGRVIYVFLHFVPKTIYFCMVEPYEWGFV